MLDRLSANALLKSVIATLATIVVVMLAASAWQSWQRLATENRILAVADVSGFAFKAMHNLRTDRSTTVRSVNDAAMLDPEAQKYVREIREVEMPALRSAADRLRAIDFPDRSPLLPELERAIEKLTALQGETWDAFTKSKAARRAGLGDEYMAEETKLLETLDKLSSSLFAWIKHNDAFIDQMMEMKELAWMARYAGGDASLTVSNGLAKGRLPPEARQKYAASMRSIPVRRGSGAA